MMIAAETCAEARTEDSCDTGNRCLIYRVGEVREARSNKT